MAATKVNMQGTITTTNIGMTVNVLNRPSYGADVIGTLNKGYRATLTEQDGEWYKISTGGWIHRSYLTNLTDLGVVDVDKTINEESVKKVIDETKKVAQTVANVAQGIADYAKDRIAQNKKKDKTIVDSLLVNNLNGIYGIPYQFMENVDPRIGNKNSTIGRKYADRILSKMPLLCLTPGRVDFMSNYHKNDKRGILAKLITGDEDAEIQDIIKNHGRYFTFAFAYEEYFEYVNSLCQICAKFLGIHDVILDIGSSPPTRAADFDWSLALNSDLKSTLTSQDFIGFYMDSTDSVSESFSNQTTQSQLANTVNGFSDQAKELSFLLGMDAGKTHHLLDQTKLTDALAAVDSITNKYLSGSALLGNIAGNFSTIATGGKLLFPEIWSDSEFSRDFDISIKLRTPDSDVLSWYLNICVPICHLIGLAAGHQSKDTGNGYYSPFLVRAFYKGLFNVDMGIVTSLSIRKGKEAAWNVDGLPTEVDIDISIKDLYNMLSIVPGTSPKAFVTNNLLMDYIANMCGININQMDLARSVEIYLILAKNKIVDIPNRIFGRFQDAIDTYGMDLYDAVLNKFLI